MYITKREIVNGFCDIWVGCSLEKYETLRGDLTYIPSKSYQLSGFGHEKKKTPQPESNATVDQTFGRVVHLNHQP